MVIWCLEYKAIKMIRLIILLLVPTVCFSQTSPIKAELIIFKDSFERFEPFEYCMKFWNSSEDSIEMHRLSQKTPILEVRELGTNNEWKELWKSGQNINDDCNVWVNPGDVIHLSPRPPDTYKLSNEYKYSSQKLVYYPVFEKNKTLDFYPKTTFEIRVKKDFGENHGLVFSEPKIIFIKKDNLFNLDFFQELIKMGLNSYSVYVPWHLCGVRLNPTSVSDSLKGEFLKLIEKHPNSDFYDWIQFQNNSCQDFVIYSDETKSIEFFDAQNRLLEKMIANDFYPTCLLFEHLNNNLSTKFQYGDAEFFFHESDRIEEKRKEIGLSCHCN